MNTRDGKHPDKIERHRRPNGEGAGPHPEHREAGEVEKKERKAADKVHAIWAIAFGLRAFRGIIRVDPLGYGCANDAETV